MQEATSIDKDFNESKQQLQQDINDCQDDHCATSDDATCDEFQEQVGFLQQK